MGLYELNKEFNTKYSSQTDNIFEAINLWSRDATNLAKESEGLLSDSECLNSCLTGKYPDNYKTRKRIVDAEIQYIENFIDKALCEVDDLHVKDSVIATLSCSRKLHNLKYVYTYELTDGQKSRVRILSRMIWYSIYPKRRSDG